MAFGNSRRPHWRERLDGWGWGGCRTWCSGGASLWMPSSKRLPQAKATQPERGFRPAHAEAPRPQAATARRQCLTGEQSSERAGGRTSSKLYTAAAVAHSWGGCGCRSDWFATWGAPIRQAHVQTTGHSHRRHHQAAQSTSQSPPPLSPSATPAAAVPLGAMEFSPAEHPPERVLQDAIFPAFGNGAGNPSVESPEEMQKKDPLGTQIWKLYSRAKTQLPNAERMENLTWRMMAMNMRRAELDRNRGYACRHASADCAFCPATANGRLLHAELSPVSKIPRVSRAVK